MQTYATHQGVRLQPVQGDGRQPGQRSLHRPRAGLPPVDGAGGAHWRAVLRRGRRLLPRGGALGAPHAPGAYYTLSIPLQGVWGIECALAVIGTGGPGIPIVGVGRLLPRGGALGAPHPPGYAPPLLTPPAPLLQVPWEDLTSWQIMHTVGAEGKRLPLPETPDPAFPEHQVGISRP
eukprot:1196295-Prorocentrum_minimum.AAC.3